MVNDLPSRYLVLYAVLVSGISCLVYTLSIAFFINPEMDEYALVIVTPFLSFIFIDLLVVFLNAKPIDRILLSTSGSTKLSQVDIDQFNRAHHRLSYGLFNLFIASTVVIHLLTGWIEDGGPGFLVDPDSWSLFINRCA